MDVKYSNARKIKKGHGWLQVNSAAHNFLATKNLKIDLQLGNFLCFQFIYISKVNNTKKKKKISNSDSYTIFHKNHFTKYTAPKLQNKKDQLYTTKKEAAK